jgi:hypothetical protein
MQAAKIGDLVERKTGILNQPYGSCFRHQRISHNTSLVFLLAGVVRLARFGANLVGERLLCPIERRSYATSGGSL